MACALPQGYQPAAGYLPDCVLPIRLCPHAGVEDVDVAVKAARKAFDEGPWPRMGGKVGWTSQV
jgi:hypothetical protein